MATTRKVQKLMEDAYELLDSYSCDEAVKIGLKLLKLGYSGAYEILALAYYRTGERQRAMETLNEGLKKAPDVWLLWQLIGNIYSDDGKYVEAHEAFARSLTCPGVDESWVRYNQAVALSRQERYLESLAQCLQVSNFELELDCITLTVSLLRWSVPVTPLAPRNRSSPFRCAEDPTLRPIGAAVIVTGPLPCTSTSWAVCLTWTKSWRKTTRRPVSWWSGLAPA